MWFQQVPFDLKERAQLWGLRNNADDSRPNKPTPQDEEVSSTSVSQESSNPSLLRQFQYPPGAGDNEPTIPSEEVNNNNTRQQFGQRNTISGLTYNNSNSSVGMKDNQTNQKDNSFEEENEFKRAERLARNRESARQSRLRKKEYLGQLEEKISVLMQELSIAKKVHLEKGEDQLIELRRSHIQALSERLKLYNENAALGMNRDRELASELTALFLRTNANSEERIAVRNHQFKEMNKASCELQSRFLISLMMQPQHFFNQDSNWSLLCGFLKLSPHQQQQVKDMNADMCNTQALLDAKKRLDHQRQVLHQLWQSTRASAVHVQERWRSLCSILTPAQLVMYLGWYQKNSQSFSNAKLSEMAHDEMLKYCLQNQSASSSSSSTATSSSSSISSSLKSTAVSLIEGVIRSSFSSGEVGDDKRCDKSLTSTSGSAPNSNEAMKADLSGENGGGGRVTLSALTSRMFNNEANTTSTPPNSNPFSLSNTVQLISKRWPSNNEEVRSSIMGLEENSENWNQIVPYLPELYQDVVKLSKLKSILSQDTNTNFSMEEELFLFAYLQNVPKLKHN